MISLLRFIVRILFRFRAINTGVLKTPGPVLLIPNHPSWLDWLFLGVCLDEDWRFVTSSRTAETVWFLRKVMVNRRTFPVVPTSPYAVREMADFLEKGGRLVLFAEGRISVTGSLMKLFEGTGFLIRKTGAKVITCHLHGAKRVRFVRHSGWTRWFPRVTALFGPVLNAPVFPGLSPSEDRARLTVWLRDEMVRQQFEADLAHGPATLPAAIGATVAAIPSRIALEDATYSSLNYRRLATAADALASLWPREPRRIGLLLPNVNALPVTLLSLWQRGHTPVLINYTTGSATLLTCARLAGLDTIITSRAFLERARLDIAPLAAAGIAILHLEDLRPQIRTAAKLAALLRNRLSPGLRLRRAPVQANDTAVILFTSGSEGIPKGVELTHRNLLANILQVSAVADLTEHDRFFNALPLFHSFGLTAGTLFPLVRGAYTFLYPTPLHYRVVPTLVYDRQCTVLMGTNTFLNGYARKAHPYDFTSVRWLVAGAEKVQSSTLDTWARKFGVRILEGYGATECSPCLSLNTRMEPGLGTAGRFLPGVEHRLEPVEGVTSGGRLLVRGPNIMKGYLNADAHARFAALDGWYDTGDIVELDTNGFVHICGRLKRFAKISGEMVSLGAVEEALDNAFSRFGPRCQVAVVARPDSEKGEALVAVTNEPRLDLAAIRAVLRERGLPNLCAPRELRVVPAIPKLGTGKTDHRTLQRFLAADPAATTAA